jgi:flagellar hook-associated protein 1
MSDLLSLLSLGSAGIAAQNTGVSVATNNVANVNTPGYSRQRVDLESLLGAPLVGGVRSGSPERIADDLLAGRVRVAGGALAMSQAFSDALQDLQSRLTGGGSTIDEDIATLFSKIGRVAASPTDPASRDAVVASARALVQGIHRRATDAATARREADARIRDAATKVTALANQLAATNKQIAKSADPTLRDHRDELAKQLAQLVGGHTQTTSEGGMRFVLDNGAVLVDGTHAASLAATAGANGLAKLEVVDGANRRDITATVGGGSVGADLTFRDTTSVTVSNKLDQLAFDLASKMNAVSTANAALDGTTGHAMFVAPAQVSGAADALELDPGLDADSSLLATAAAGAPAGDNRGALALFALGSQAVATGGVTFSDAALSVVGDVAQAGAEANGDVVRNGLVAQHLDALRDSLSGVDTQEELANLARFEHASSAMTKFVSTIDDMLGNLIDQL